MNVSDLISLVRDIYGVCQSVSASKKMVKASGDKLVTLTPLLGALQQQQGLSQEMVDGLQFDLRALKTIVQKAQQMNRLLYIIKASSIHDDVESLLSHIQFSLGALSVHQNMNLQSNLEQFQTQWKRRDEELAEIRLEEQQLREELLKGNSSHTLMDMCRTSSDNDDTENATATQEELKEAHRAMQQEQEEIQRILLESHDSVQTSKLALEEAFLGQIIAALKAAKEQQLVAAVEGSELQQEQDQREESKRKEMEDQKQQELIRREQQQQQQLENLRQREQELLRLEHQLKLQEIQHDQELKRQEEERKQQQVSYTQCKKGLPDWVLCPVTSEVMTDPVTVDAKCLHNVSRTALQEWIQRGNTTCPFCSQSLRSSEKLSPNVQLRDAIEEAIRAHEKASIRSDAAARALATIRVSQTTREIIPGSPDNNMWFEEASVPKDRPSNQGEMQEIEADLEKGQTDDIDETSYPYKSAEDVPYSFPFGISIEGPNTIGARRRGQGEMRPSESYKPFVKLFMIASVAVVIALVAAVLTRDKHVD